MSTTVYRLVKCLAVPRCVEHMVNPDEITIDDSEAECCLRIFLLRGQGKDTADVTSSLLPIMSH